MVAREHGHGDWGGRDRGGIVGLGARVHLFIPPAEREAFMALFRDVLGCEVLELDFGLEHPVLLVRLEDGSAFSVEATDLAPQPMSVRAVDDGTAPRGAWIEFRTRELDRQQRSCP